ncbi:hypothetical protein ABVT39_022288 [Epinephelus coioides]
MADDLNSVDRILAKPNSRADQHLRLIWCKSVVKSTFSRREEICWEAGEEVNVRGEMEAAAFLSCSETYHLIAARCEGKRLDATPRRRREHELRKELLRLAAAEASEEAC